MVFQKFYSAHKNVTVIFLSKYRRIRLIENGFVVRVLGFHILSNINVKIQ